MLPVRRQGPSEASPRRLDGKRPVSVGLGTAELSHQRLAMPNVPAPQGQLWRSNIATFRWLQHLGSGPVETAPTW